MKFLTIGHSFYDINSIQSINGSEKLLSIAVVIRGSDKDFTTALLSFSTKEEYGDAIREVISCVARANS